MLLFVDYIETKKIINQLKVTAPVSVSAVHSRIHVRKIPLANAFMPTKPA
jgi:hypothetical protein